MILFKSYPLDFKQVQKDVGDYLPDDITEILDAGIAGTVSEIILEAPYVDKDFRDTYYHDFSKRFVDISRDSIRLHLFFKPNDVSSENYAGFVTLRDTKVNTIGRSYLNPRALADFTDGYFCLAKFNVNFKGQNLTVEAFPWMQQDGNVSRCAHIAAWGINRYFSERYSYYSERTLHEITIHDSNTRRVPSKGASVEQIAQILQRNRFDPEIYIKDNGPEDVYYTEAEFSRLIYTFIESGIPCIAGIRKKAHAVVIIGHGKISEIDQIISDSPGIVDSYELIEEIILADDNELPYTRAYNYNNSGFYSVEDINVIIVPFYEKMYLDVNWLYSKMLPVLQREVLKIDEGESLIRRVFLTSSRSFKRFTYLNCKDKSYSEIIQCMQMPKFIWIAEYSSPEEYKIKLIRHRIILDATMLNFQDESFMTVKKQREVAINNKSVKRMTVETDCDTDTLYENNLRRMYELVSKTH